MSRGMRIASPSLGAPVNQELRSLHAYINIALLDYYNQGSKMPVPFEPLNGQCLRVKVIS